MATIDDPVEVIAALIGKNWNRKLRFRKLIPKIYTHWIDQKDVMPAITVWEIFSPISTRNLAANTLVKFKRLKVILRSHDKQDIHKMEEENERILVTNNQDVSVTGKYINTGIQLIRILNTVDIVDDPVVHRRDMDIELIIQKAY